MFYTNIFHILIVNLSFKRKSRPHYYHLTTITAALAITMFPRECQQPPSSPPSNKHHPCSTTCMAVPPKHTTLDLAATQKDTLLWLASPANMVNPKPKNLITSCEMI